MKSSHRYTLVLTVARPSIGEAPHDIEYQYPHQLPAFKDFRRLSKYIGKEGYAITAVRLIRDDGYDCNGFAQEVQTSLKDDVIVGTSTQEAK